MHLLFLLLLGLHKGRKQPGHLIQFPLKGHDLFFQLLVRDTKAGSEVAHDHLHLEGGEDRSHAGGAGFDLCLEVS